MTSSRPLTSMCLLKLSETDTMEGVGFELVSELLFECYRVPKVSFGIDGLYSLYHNKRAALPTSAIVVSSGYNCTHILPVLNGRLDGKNSSRIISGASKLCLICIGCCS
ncbi:unnamed protein product [Ranitomeya imitator]|uniref:Actin-related protein 5 n=1 Tax=Ranitomeya imitator TaxID=111125 RepID=A0ABN9L8M5_9NEOB|nr:unnamed protein product [Ranitomeya imitator]